MPAVKKTISPAVKKKAVAKPLAAEKAVVAKKVTKPKKPVRVAEAVAKADVPSVATAAHAGVKVRKKLVRDSFTMPQADFDLIEALKARALVFLRPAKKSELLRAGLHALVGLSDEQLRSALNGLAPLKAGRPKKAD